MNARAKHEACLDTPPKSGGYSTRTELHCVQESHNR